MRTKLRIRNVAVLFVTGALVFSVAAPASAVSDRERKMKRWINHERASRGIRKLKLSDSLSRKARRHSKKMAANGRVVYHSNLRYTLRNYNYRIAGENVGMASTLKRVHRMFMGSRGHRANILRSGYRKVGVGVYKANGRVWVTQIFIG